MVIDSSALLAIVFGEADSEVYSDTISDSLEAHRKLRLPASVLIEVNIAAERRRGQYAKRLAGLIDGMQPEIVSLTAPIARLSVVAFRKFGKGMHKAALNFGDCMSYGTAEYLNEPLLYKGNDFSHTPIRSVLPRTF